MIFQSNFRAKMKIEEKTESDPAQARDLISGHTVIL